MVFLWFEEHPTVGQEYKNKCPFCGSKDIWSDGYFADGIHFKYWFGFKCRNENCTEEWSVVDIEATERRRKKEGLL